MHALWSIAQVIHTLSSLNHVISSATTVKINPISEIGDFKAARLSYRMSRSPRWCAVFVYCISSRKLLKPIDGIEVPHATLERGQCNHHYHLRSFELF
jgi:hypothetical protein